VSGAEPTAGGGPATGNEPAGEAASAGAAATGDGRRRKALLLLLVGGPVLAADLLTKAWVLDTFTLYETVPVLGEFFRFTYTHNPGAAFGINIGEHSRIFFLVLAVLALGILAWLYLVTPAWDRLRLYAVALVTGGAVGNIVDRIRFERGVVDFLDVGIGAYRWPVFNVADAAVSVGAVLLLVSFYLEERRERDPPGADA
jgi:signal peptidase II